MPFDNATRRKIIRMPQQSKPTGGGAITWQLPRTGLLARVWLIVNATVAGTLSAPNALGFSSIIRRVRLTANSGIDIFNVSGPGYEYLVTDLHELGGTVHPRNDGRVAVTATTAQLNMVIPVQMNQRDPIGLLMLQSEQTVLTLSVDFETDSVVATGATVTVTVDPYLEVFTVPVDPADWPPLNVIHQILEDQQIVSGAGEVTYQWPRGNRYLQMVHGAGINAAGSGDAFSRVQVRLNQSDYLMDVAPGFLDAEFEFNHDRIREPGTIFIDLMSSSGLGMYDKTRDTIDSGLVTDLATVITATGATTLYSVRRQLVTLA